MRLNGVFPTLLCVVSSLSCAPLHLLAEGPCVVRLKPGAEITLDGSGSFDPESRQIFHAWRQTSGPPVDLRESDTPWPRFVPVAPGLYEFELVVRSAPAPEGNSLPQHGLPAILSVNVLPPNRPPLIEIEDRLSAEPGQWVVLDGGRVSDPDGDEMILAWSQTSGERILMEPGHGRSRRVRVRAWHSGTYGFRLSATDASGASAHADVILTVAPHAPPPVAVARMKTPTGEDHIALRLAEWPHPEGGPNHRPIASARALPPDEYGIVVLDATASLDPDEDALRYTWRQISGPLVRTLSALGERVVSADSPPDLARVEFRPPGGGTYVFELVVEDGTLKGDPARVSVEIGGTPSSAPMVETAREFDRATIAFRPSTPGICADAGEDLTVDVGSEAVLNGKRSKGSPGAMLRYNWHQISGPHVQEFRFDSMRDEASPRFIPGDPGRYKFSLVVSEDDEHWSDPSFVTVTVPAPNRPPFLHVPSQLSVRAGQVVRLAAYAGDPDGDEIRIRWRRTGGARVRLAAKNGHAAFVAPEYGNVELSVSVSDESGARVAKTVEIATLTDGKPPVASARIRSPERPKAGKRVLLDGTGSYDPEGEVLAYRWDIGDQTLVRLEGRNDAVAGFIPPAPGRYSFNLVVESRGRHSTPAAVAVVVEGEAEPLVLLTSPVPPRVTLGSPVVLDASRSRVGDASPVLSWSQTCGPTLEPVDSIAARRVLRPSRCGVYAFGLMRAGSDTPVHTVEFAVQNTNAIPTAVLQSDVAVSTAEVILDGSASYDPEGDPLRYSWIQTAGSPLDLPAPYRGTARLVLTAVAPGDYAVRLVVTDGERVARSNEAEFSIPVRSDPNG